MISRLVRTLLPVLACCSLPALRAEPVISEFLAANVTGAEDEDGNREDWIEIFNPDTTPVNLAGWRLTDDAANPAKWTFPSVVIPPKGYLVVWASNKNRNAGQLHTNFKLDATGEYLGLIRPDGSAAHEFSPTYPPQAADISYGASILESQVNLVGRGSPALVRVPTNGVDAATWMNVGYDASAWSNRTAGVGFDLTAAPAAAFQPWANSVAEFSGVQGQNNWYYGLYERNNDTNGVYNVGDFTTTYQPVAGDGTARAWSFSGGVWDVIPGNPPWSTITNTGGHPAGGQAGGYQATVRRWVSEFSGIARVTGRMGHGGGCGDGVVHRIFVEGMPVFARTVSASTVEYTVTFPVLAGQRVDFYTDPGAAGNDGCDGFTYTARITSEALADSVADWTETGTQGTRGWTYGYWNRSTDSNQVYEVNEFANFPRSTVNGNTVTATNAWDGTRWKTAAAPLIELTQNGGKPQITGGTNWVIRRWTSTYAGPVRIMGLIGNAGGGDGITGRLLINGTPLLTRTVSATSEGYSAVTNLAVGTRVDLALDPNATETGDADSIFSATITAAAAQSTVVADSIAQWGTGAQNANGWSYGYYNRTADANGLYEIADFNNTDPNWVAGWTLGPGNPPWTELTRTYTHPNSTANGGEHWAVRRWTSTISGSASVDWQVSKQNASGNGVTLKVFLNGGEIASTAIAGADRLGVSGSTPVYGLKPGDVLDLALTPVGPTGLTDDGADGSTVSARVLQTTTNNNLSRSLLADSAADWSTSGLQGYKSWTYGYYNRTDDAGGVFAPADFIPFPRDNGPHSASNFWTGFGYDWYLGNPPWTYVAALDAHPNGTNNAKEHWVIRRWTAVTNGTVDVEWLVRKTNTSGSGVTLKVIHNGLEVDSGAIAGNNTSGLARTVRITGVSAGDPIDICLTPVGLSGATDDGSDGCQFSAKIYQVRQFSDEIHPSGDLAEVMHGVNASAYVRIPFVFTNTLDRMFFSLGYDDGFVAYLNGSEIARRNVPVAQANARLADSVADFGGLQGGNNWFYGYYPQNADPGGNGRYDATDLVTNDPNWTFAAGAWNQGPGNPPWTQLYSTGGHPNGSNNGAVQWAVRRWVAEAEGTLHVYTTHNKPTFGTGTTGRLFHNGVEKWTSVTNDPVGNQGYLAITDVRVGDSLDLALDALGLGGDTTDGSDASTLTAVFGQMASSGLVWNASAVQARPAAETGLPFELDLTALAPILIQGTNVLAVHGLNVSKSDPDFLVAPTLSATTVEINLAQLHYHPAPTPGAANGPGSTTIGPVISDVVRAPAGVVDGTTNVVITATLTKSVDDITSVRLYHRTNFGNESMIPMTPVGPPNPDGSGVYQAAIPANAAAPGQMLRWRLVAQDANGDIMRNPPFADPLDSPEYFGVVIANTNLVSKLPILHTFLSNPPAADVIGGTRMSFGYGDQFFDNVFINLHGQSSSGFPKKSYNVKLNTGFKLRWNPGEPAINSFNLLTTYPDKANMRNLLAMETWRDAGAAHHFAYPVQMRRNGNFFSVTHLMEDGDADFLQRLGIDERNALYKVYNSLENANVAVNNGGGSEKKNREWESFADLQALVAGVAQTGAAERQFLYDNAGVPESVNYLAALTISGNTDTGHKNYYMVRDSEGNREWFPTPWDVDLSYGRVWTGGYFDDVLYTNTPFYVSNGNRFMGPFLDNSQPELRQMYLRRLRTLADTLLQPVSTATTNRLLEAKIDAYDLLMAADTTLDYNAWPTWGSNQTQTVAVNLLKTYLDGRRNFVFSHPDLPAAQATNTVVTFGPLEFNPSSGNQAEEYFTLVNTNAVAVDVSGWRVTGAVGHTLKPGTVIPAGGTLHLSPNVNAFRARAASPKGNESRFVQGDYSGQLSARGETLELWDGARLVATNQFAGAATPAQLGLRVSELDYNPGPRVGALQPDRQQYEFIELVNVWTGTLSLAGVTFTNGVDFVCPAVLLDPGARRIIVKNLDAFHERHPGADTNLVLGVFTGSLNNAGERLTLLDPSGEEILDFTYQATWHPLTDGQGFSLTAASETQEPDLWNAAIGWKPSGTLFGTPTLPDAAGDSDGDNVPDLWEAQNSFDPLNNADAAQDADADGSSNHDEYVAGTQPRSSLSVLNVSANAAGIGSFPGLAGRTYTVQYRDSLASGAWQKLADFAPVADGNIAFLDPDAANRTGRLYRIVTPMQP